MIQFILTVTPALTPEAILQALLLGALGTVFALDAFVCIYRKRPRFFAEAA